MKPDDLPAVSVLAVRSKASWGYSPEEMEIFSSELTLTCEYLNQMDETAVAIHEGEIVGYYTLKDHSHRVTELDHLFVSASHFQEGIGRQLLTAALEAARKRGAETLKVISDPNAEGFYRRHGATKVHDHQSSIPGRSIPVMEIPLRLSA